MPKKEKIFPLSTVGGRLQSLRHGAKLSRSQFYDKVRPFGEAGSDSSKDKTVSNWESGKTQLDYDSLIAVCNILNCDTDYLLGLQETTRKEYAHITQMTGLTNQASEFLASVAAGDPDSLTPIGGASESGAFFLKTLSDLIEDSARLGKDKKSGYGFLMDLSHFRLCNYGHEDFDSDDYRSALLSLHDCMMKFVSS